MSRKDKIEMFTWDAMVVFYSQFGFYKENN